MLPEVSRSTPYGSPTGGSSDRDSDRRYEDERRSDAPDLGDAAPTAKIDPIEIRGSDRPSLQSAIAEPSPRLKPPPPPNEFEQFVASAIGKSLPRFGAGLLLPANRDYATPATATVPPGYVLNVGDIVAISMTGSIEGSVDKEIDTNGKIFLPRVGSIQLAGVRYGDLKQVISNAVGTQYRGYTVNVGIRQLRGVRVYVTGFANNPGAYTVNSLSTMSNAVLAAGGPAAGGSFRSVKLYRNNELVSDFDLYQFILGGDKSADAVLQNEDVLVIPPVGQEVAISGSVNAEAIYEAKAGETLEKLLSYAGGLNNLADRSRLMLYRLSNFDSVGVKEISRVDAASMPAESGDIVQILSEGTLFRSVSKQSVLVRIEGEVNAPGSYYVPANTRLSAVVDKAGGLSNRAFVFGTRFERSSVRRQQRESFNEAIQQLEISLAAAPLTADQSDQSVGAGERAAQVAGARAVLDRLRDAQPDGRVVLDLSPGASTLPGDMVLENNDRIVVPPRPTTVGVFGAVYRPASFSLDGARPLRVGDYLDRAGGPLRAADKKGIFVVRANGAVLSQRNGALKAYVLPGDVIFVPVKTQANSTWAKIKDITTTLFQLGLGAATLIAVTR
jgi:protein involved in polysaccharide export with SLBB domain